MYNFRSSYDLNKTDIIFHSEQEKSSFSCILIFVRNIRINHGCEGGPKDHR